MSDYLNGVRFELAEPQLPPPPTLADITALMEQIEAGKQRVLCAPDVFEQVRDTVYSRGYGLYYKVLKCPYLRDGQVVKMQSESEEREDFERSMQEWAAGMFPATERFSDLPWIIRSGPSEKS